MCPRCSEVAQLCETNVLQIENVSKSGVFPSNALHHYLGVEFGSAPGNFEMMGILLCANNRSILNSFYYL